MTDDTPKIELFGVEELDKFFQSLGNYDQSKIIMNAYREGSKSMIAKAKQNLRAHLKSKSKRGNLEKSIGFVPGRIGRSSAVWAKIGARRFGAYRGFHGHLYDAGTVERSTKQGFNRGAMPASHFFTESVEQESGAMMQDVERAMLGALEKFIEKGLQKQQMK